MIAAIVAMSKNRVIGNNGSIPWYFTEDMRYFRKLTLYHNVIMGRKTHESIGRTLPHRNNIIITRNYDYKPLSMDCRISHSVEGALGKIAFGTTFIIGGGEIYRQAMPFLDTLFITEINQDIVGDTTFPELGKNWHCVHRISGHTPELIFTKYEKITNWE